MGLIFPHSLPNWSLGARGTTMTSLLTKIPAAVWMILLWALVALPNLSVRSFIWEEGTNAELARDILKHGSLTEPSVYGIGWIEKPSLLPCLIAGVARVSGEVNEWSARLPAMLASLATALLVLHITRKYASLAAAYFAAGCLLFSPMLLRKLTISEP